MANVRRQGLTLLSPAFAAASAPEPAYNIVFIHGLRGHPRKTWTAAVGKQEQPPKAPIFRLLPGSRSIENNEIQQGAFWPEDFLVTDLPDAAIYTYGYDADLVDGYIQGPNKNSVFQNSNGFMIDVALDIKNNRPIMFVAHSLGGIIVKDALGRSEISINPSYHRLHKQTYVVVFLGTPHRGSEITGWGEIISKVAGLTGLDVDRKLMKTLNLNSEVLDRIHENFLLMLHIKDIKVHTFIEGQGISGTKGLTEKVVGDFSSSIGLVGEDRETINSNHMQMARYSSRDDEGYRKILRCLKRNAEEINTRSDELESTGSPNTIMQHTTETTTQLQTTRLHMASNEGQASLVDQLLAAGDYVNAIDRHRRTPLHYAAQGAFAEIVYLLLRKGATRDAKDREGLTPMDLTLDQDVIWLLQYGHQHDMTDPKGDTLLHWTIKSPCRNALETLTWALRRGYNIEARDFLQNTPLICAVGRNMRDFTRVLVDRGAQVNAKRSDGRPALVIAVNNGDYETVELLLDHAEDRDWHDNPGVLMRACDKGYTQIVQLLLSKGANFDQSDDEWTPLSKMAVSGGTFEIVRLLIDAGADVNGTANSSIRHLPLPEACHWNYVAMVEYLLQEGADFEHRGRMHEAMGGETLLIAAMRRHNLEVCECLLRHGADMNYRDSSGKSAVDWAREGGDARVARWLLQYS